MDIMVGLFALLVGLTLVVSGFIVLRLVVIPAWGALIGFAIGAGSVAAIANEEFLASVWGWVAGLAMAAVIAALAYLIWSVEVALFAGVAGFALAAWLLTVLGVDWGWFAATISLVFAGAAVFWALVADMPRVVLTVFSALAGATAVTIGLALIFGVVNTADLASEASIRGALDDWWWMAIFGVAALAGSLIQTATLNRMGLAAMGPVEKPSELAAPAIGTSETSAQLEWASEPATTTDDAGTIGTIDGADAPTDPSSSEAGDGEG